MGADTKRPVWIAKPLVPTERVRAPEWFIDGMLPENCLAVLYGQPGSFKTFTFIAVAMCLATGIPFCGRRTKRCNPLYIAADPDPDTPRERGQAWTIHHELVLKERGIVDFSNAVMFEKAVNLHKEDEVSYARDSIKEQGLKPDVIFFDTLFHSSIGADLTKPDQLLPILSRARWLMAEVGARTGFLAHHTPKDGQTLFGTQALKATVDVVWRADAIDETKATLSCERIKRARVFAPLELTFHAMKLQMIPNSFGDEMVEQLVLDLNVKPAAKKKTKEDQDLAEMEFVLETFLGNKATFTAWLEQMWKFAKVKKDDKDKKGWSKRSFSRKLDILKNAGRITSGGKQGDLYSVLYTEEAKRARMGDTTGASETGVAETGASQVVTVPPLRGVAPVAPLLRAGMQCQTGAMTPDGTASRPDCENDDTTQQPGVVPSDGDLIKQGIEATKAKAG